MIIFSPPNQGLVSLVKFLSKGKLYESTWNSVVEPQHFVFLSCKSRYANSTHLWNCGEQIFCWFLEMPFWDKSRLQQMSCTTFLITVFMGPTYKGLYSLHCKTTEVLSILQPSHLLIVLSKSKANCFLQPITHQIFSSYTRISGFYSAFYKFTGWWFTCYMPWLPGDIHLLAYARYVHYLLFDCLYSNWSHFLISHILNNRTTFFTSISDYDMNSVFQEAKY